MSTFVECPDCEYEFELDAEPIVKELHHQLTTEGKPAWEVLDELFRDHGLLWRGEGLEGSDS